jgi:hypothetical protein
LIIGVVALRDGGRAAEQCQCDGRTHETFHDDLLGMRAWRSVAMADCVAEAVGLLFDPNI